MPKKVQIPSDLFQKLVRASEAFEDFSDALEDFLISRDPRLIRNLRKARSESLSRKTRPWEEFKREVSRSNKPKS